MLIVIGKTQAYDTSEEPIWIRTEEGRLFAKRWQPREQIDPGPIVLFHESLGCVDLWRNFPARLAARSRRAVIAYDRLGFGRSDPHPHRLGPHFIEREAQTTLPRLIQALDVERFIVCGHSVGGGMAIEAAAAHPERCRAVVTISAQSFVEQRTISGIEKAKNEFNDASRFGKLARHHGDKAAWVLDAWLDTWLSPVIRTWTLDRALALLRCPVLAIHGDRDEFASVRQAERIAAGGSPGSLIVMPDTGHAPHRETPHLLVELMADFLDGIH